MTRRIKNISYNLNAYVNSWPQEKLGFWLIGAILVSLVIYISGLNFAISEAFHQQKIERDLKIMRQDLQSREELFITTLSAFYESHAESFGLNSGQKELFVSRDASVALVNLPILR